MAYFQLQPLYPAPSSYLVTSLASLTLRTSHDPYRRNPTNRRVHHMHNLYNRSVA